VKTISCTCGGFVQEGAFVHADTCGRPRPKAAVKLTAKQIALLNIIDACRADMANGAEYMFEQPNTHEALPTRTAEAVERNMHKILDALNARLPRGVRR
jgi:hypothetical protein